MARFSFANRRAARHQTALMNIAGVVASRIEEPDLHVLILLVQRVFGKVQPYQVAAARGYREVQHVGLHTNERWSRLCDHCCSHRRCGCGERGRFSTGGGSAGGCGRRR